MVSIKKLFPRSKYQTNIAESAFPLATSGHSLVPPAIRMAPDFYINLLRAIPIPVAARDVQGNFIGCNPAFEKFVGRPRSEIIGKTNYDLLPRQWADTDLIKDQEVIKNRHRIRYEQHLTVPMDGMVDIYVDTAPIMDQSDNIVGIACAISDVSELKSHEKHLSDATYRLESLLNVLPMGIIIIDPATRKIVDLNPQAMLMLGYSVEQVTGRDCGTVVCSCPTDSCPLTNEGEIFEKSESVITDSEGRNISVIKTTIKTEIDNRELLLECFLDITEQKFMENRLRELAETDYLTGIFNRRHFISLAEKERCRSKRTQNPLSMLILDIDWFKAINDRYGHATGDEVLKCVAEICKQAVRDFDIVGRIGGEEFAILLAECSLSSAQAVAERIRSDVEYYDFSSDGNLFRCTVSIGIAEYIGNANDLETLMKQADTTLYHAKNLGRNRVCWS